MATEQAAADVAAVAAELSRLDVRFVVGKLWTHGWKTFDLPAREVAQYVADPDAWVARQCGVHKEDLAGWYAAGMVVQCCGKTAKGRRCRALVPGGAAPLEPADWVSLSGGYCALHGGGQ
jgi:hypothetical protein